MKKIPIVVVAGPTASGKTALAINIAKKYSGEIVNADSMQIYKFMNIGTAKPTKEEQGEAKHHLLDFVEPDCEFSVADYTELAHKVIADIHKRGKLPIICGGTGLYINSVIDDVTFGEVKTDYAMREELENIAKEQGVEVLMNMLSEFDEESAREIHPNNLRRVIRAIEFYKLTGVPISKHKEMTKQIQSRYNPLMLVIEHDRKKLYERINLRVDMMLEDGLIDELKSLLKKGYTKNMNSMKGIGYKEIISYLEGDCSIEEAIDAVKLGSRHYAKRQMTWFRRDERVNYIDAQQNVAECAYKLIEEWKNEEL